MPRAQPGQRFGGRQKGTPNKVPAQLKEIILEALHGAHKDGAVGYLKWLSAEHPPVFGGLVGKVLPMTVAGDKDNPLEHNHHIPATDAERAAAIVAMLAKRKG